MHQFGGELLKTLAGINFAHAAYEGGAPAPFAVLSGKAPRLL